MEWLNEPASWQRTGDVLTVSVDPGTDFWRETGYGYIRDSGHVYGEVLAGDLDVSVRLRCTLGAQYDQAGVMLRADERTWLKTGVEFFEGRARLSTVLTHGRSSWMVTDLPEGTDEIVLKVSRRGDAVEVRYVIEDGPAELAALVFMPPDREVLAGVMAAAPEGPGFRVTFHDLRITERDWSGAAGEDAAAWPDDQPGWTGEAAPAWAPADGAPEWPATAEEEPPAWPVPAPGDEDPDWPAGTSGDEEPGWPVPGAADDDPAWPATASGEEEPEWPVGGDGEPGWAAAPAAADAAGPDHGAMAEPAGEDSAGAGAGAGPALAAPAAGPEPEAAEPEPEAAEPEPEAAEPEPGPVDRAPTAPEPVGENGSPSPWSPAPVTGFGDWAGPAPGGAADDVDPAADWEQLAAGAQAAARVEAGGTRASRWHAQPDTEVANEWPGPPLRTALRNGVAGDAAPGPAGDQSVDDAQTDPGLPKPRPAADTGPSAVSLPDGSPAKPGEPEPVPTGREARRARSKRGAADLPVEPDAADEWISLLTADPGEE
jgi:regulation of enolase protein 1 (concanavalin A-like superfamily)